MTEDDIIIRAVTAKLLGPPKLGSWVRVIGQAFANYEGEVTEIHSRLPGVQYGVRLQLDVEPYGETCLFFAYELMVLR